MLKAWSKQDLIDQIDKMLTPTAEEVLAENKAIRHRLAREDKARHDRIKNVNLRLKYMLEIWSTSGNQPPGFADVVRERDAILAADSVHPGQQYTETSDERQVAIAIDKLDNKKRKKTSTPQYDRFREYLDNNPVTPLPKLKSISGVPVERIASLSGVPMEKIASFSGFAVDGAGASITEGQAEAWKTELLKLQAENAALKEENAAYKEANTKLRMNYGEMNARGKEVAARLEDMQKRVNQQERQIERQWQQLERTEELFKTKFADTFRKLAAMTPERLAATARVIQEDIEKHPHLQDFIPSPPKGTQDEDRPAG